MNAILCDATIPLGCDLRVRPAACPLFCSRQRAQVKLRYRRGQRNPAPSTFFTFSLSSSCFTCSLPSFSGINMPHKQPRPAESTEPSERDADLEAFRDAAFKELREGMFGHIPHVEPIDVDPAVAEPQLKVRRHCG